MDELLKQFFELVKHNLGSGTITVIVVICGVVYGWYQHLRLKLLREQIDLDYKNREALLQLSKTVTDHREIQPLSYANPNVQQILIVDDEKRIVEIIEAVLYDSLLNIRIDKAFDGEEALQKIKNNPPDILITDIVMPRLTGLQLLSILHEQNRDVPAIIISAFLTKDVLKTIHNMRLVSPKELLVFSKPWDFDELLQAIRKLISRNGKLSAN